MAEPDSRIGDFRHTRDDDPEYDIEADLLLTDYYVTAVAVDSLRLSVITSLLDRDLMELSEDRQHARCRSITRGDAFLRGMKAGESPFTWEGRFMRKVPESLAREYRQNGQLRVTILPP